MTDAFIGEIRLFPNANHIPSGWVACVGQSLPTAQNQALYALIGNEFGGNNTNFMLPDLRGATIVGADDVVRGMPSNVGNTGGTDTVTLGLSQMLAHNHVLNGCDANATVGPTGAYWGRAKEPTNATIHPPQPPVYALPPTGGLTTLNASAVAVTGGSQPHENRQPYLVLVYAICTKGLWPQRP